MEAQTISNQKGFEIEFVYANTFMQRLLGLMFKRELVIGQGLMLSPCSGVHTCFMRFPIDVIYLNREYVVLGKETLKPWRVGKAAKGTRMVLEVNADESRLLQEQDRLLLAL